MLERLFDDVLLVDLAVLVLPVVVVFVPEPVLLVEDLLLADLLLVVLDAVLFFVGVLRAVVLLPVLADLLAELLALLVVLLAVLPADLLVVDEPVDVFLAVDWPDVVVAR